jgi:hypothetical protein
MLFMRDPKPMETHAMTTRNMGNLPPDETDRRERLVLSSPAARDCVISEPVSSFQKWSQAGPIPGPSFLIQNPRPPAVRGDSMTYESAEEPEGL